MGVAGVTIKRLIKRRCSWANLRQQAWQIEVLFERVGEPFEAGLAQCVEVECLRIRQPGPVQQGLAGGGMIEHAVQIGGEHLAVG